MGRTNGHHILSPFVALCLVHKHSPFSEEGPHWLCLWASPAPLGLSFLLCKGKVPLTSPGYREIKTRQGCMCTQETLKCLLSKKHFPT